GESSLVTSIVGPSRRVNGPAAIRGDPRLWNGPLMVAAPTGWPRRGLPRAAGGGRREGGGDAPRDARRVSGQGRRRGAGAARQPLTPCRRGRSEGRRAPLRPGTPRPSRASPRRGPPPRPARAPRRTGGRPA